MIVVQQNKEANNYIIKFPYDQQIIDIVREIPGRRWNPEQKVWTVPTKSVGLFLNQIYGTPLESSIQVISDENIGENAVLESTTSIPDIDLSGVSLYCKKGEKLYQHQIDTLKFAINRENLGNHSGFLLTDQPGLGKSLSSILVATYCKEHKDFEHCLIICCVNSSKYNWEREIEEQTQGKYSGYILGTRYRKNGKRYIGSGADKLADLSSNRMGKNGDPLPYFIILNVETIQKKVKEGGKSSYVVTDKIVELINEGHLNMCIIDEVHKGLSPKSIQGKCLLDIKKRTNDNCMWIPMTGTPISNKPTDVFLPLKLVDAHEFKSYYTWCNYFCVYGGFGMHNIISYKNIPYLKQLLQGNMLRRLKSQVLDLPEKVQIVEYVDSTNYQKKIVAELEKQVQEWMYTGSPLANPMTKLLRLRQVCDSPELVDDSITIDNSYLTKNAKMCRLLELVDDIIENGEKVVIMSMYLEPLRVAYRFLHAKYKNVVAFTGTLSDEQCEINKKKFMEDPNCKILLGTVGKAGTTHTFTAANNLIFYDEPWTPTDKQQCEDRIHRIGTDRTVNIYTLITKDTVDEYIHNLVYTKGVMSDYLVDNRMDIMKDSEVLRTYLMQSMMK